MSFLAKIIERIWLGIIIIACAPCMRKAETELSPEVKAVQDKIRVFIDSKPYKKK